MQHREKSYMLIGVLIPKNHRVSVLNSAVDSKPEERASCLIEDRNFERNRIHATHNDSVGA